MQNDIRAYLFIFAKNLGHILSENDDNLNKIAQQIEIRSLSNIKGILFEQKIDKTCKKCKMFYEERGSVTKKIYKYCISSGEITCGIPPNCPKLNIKYEVFDNTEDDCIADIRRKSNR